MTRTLLHAAGGRSLALLGSTEQGRGQPKKGSQQDLTEVEVLEEVLEDLLGQVSCVRAHYSEPWPVHTAGFGSCQTGSCVAVCRSLTHSLAHSCTHSLTHSLAQSSAPALLLCWTQLEEYCRLQAVRFFALSTYQYTWLCYAREGCIYMSRGIAWNSVKPTVLQVTSRWAWRSSLHAGCWAACATHDPMPCTPDAPARHAASRPMLHALYCPERTCDPLFPFHAPWCCRRSSGCA